MSGIGTGPAALTLPGIVTDLPLDTGHTGASVHYRASEYGQVAETSVILGETLQHGIVRAGSLDPAYYRRIEAAARECAMFLEGAQRSGAAA